jgi:peroxiredoxin Q/BCP
MTHQLQSGDTAPSFHTIDHNGNSVSLETYRGHKVLLAFFRNSACALCNLRIHQFIERYPKWQHHGLEIIALFESPETYLHDFVGKQNAPFHLIADPKAVIYDLYSIEISEEKVQATISASNTKTIIAEAEAEAAGFKLTHEEGSNFHRIPAEFLIDEKGFVHVTHYNSVITDNMPFEIIDRFVAGK